MGGQMKLRDLAYAVRQSVTARQVAESIGLHPDSKGFCKCPLHGEKTGSMKLYPGSRGWYCFGCHQGGSVIDLVMLYYGLDLAGAVELLNDDFNLGLPIGYEATEAQKAEAQRKAAEREAEKQKRERQEREQAEAFDRYCDLGYRIGQMRLDLTEYAPKTMDASWPGRFQEALMKLTEMTDEAERLATVCFAPKEE